jgi:hypothetical protein
MNELLKRFAKAIEGHFSIGNLTVFGDNAMHFGCHFWTKKFGYICWRLPLPCGIADKILYSNTKLYWVPVYFYISRNATPWAAVFMLGKKHSPGDWAVARLRKMHFGWNYNGDNDEHQHSLLWAINNLR